MSSAATRCKVTEADVSLALESRGQPISLQEADRNWPVSLLLSRAACPNPQAKLRGRRVLVLGTALGDSLLSVSQDFLENTVVLYL